MVCSAVRFVHRSASSGDGMYCRTRSIRFISFSNSKWKNEQAHPTSQHQEHLRIRSRADHPANYPPTPSLDAYLQHCARHDSIPADCTVNSERAVDLVINFWHMVIWDASLYRLIHDSRAALIIRPEVTVHLGWKQAAVE